MKSQSAGARRATLHDVARVAGVSTITASRSLRQSDLVSEDTRRRVEAAASKVGYIPNLVARSFKSSRSGIVAAIIPSINTPVYADTLQGISDEVNLQGQELMVGVSGLSPEHEEQLVRVFLGRQPEGLILTGAKHTRQTRTLLESAQVPVVETWTLSKRPIDMNVGYSDEAASAAMVRHLHACGYRHIGFISGPTLGNDRAVNRRRGYERAAKSLGAAEVLPIAETSGTDVAGGAEALGQLLASGARLDAVFCSSDIFAIGALFECQRRGIEVPKALGIAGFQGLPIGMQTMPALTTVEVPRYEIGRTAAQLILGRLAGNTAMQVVRDLGFRIVARGSTRAPQAI